MNAYEVELFGGELDGEIMVVRECFLGLVIKVAQLENPSVQPLNDPNARVPVRVMIWEVTNKVDDNHWQATLIGASSVTE